ncbi:MAG: OmpA family protein [Bdellovibrionia bacterium]
MRTMKEKKRDSRESRLAQGSAWVPLHSSGMVSVWVLGAFIGFGSSPGWAQIPLKPQSGNRTKGPQSASKLSILPSGSREMKSSVIPEKRNLLDFYGNFGGGYGWISEGKSFQSAQIFSTQLGAIGSLQLDSWVIDLGLNLNYFYTTGKTPWATQAKNSALFSSLELNPRYRLSSSFQLGPHISQFFGADTSFSSNHGPANTQTFLGLGVAYDTQIAELPVRLRMSVSSNPSPLADRVWMTQVGIQIPLFHEAQRKSQAERRDSLLSPQPKLERSFVVDFPKVFFKTDSSELKSDLKSLLNQLGQLLNESGKPITTLEVVAHTDPRGERAYNLALSEKRANAVLGELGLKEELLKRVKVKAFAEKHALSQFMGNSYWHLDRRVELIFALDDSTESSELVRRLEGFISAHPEMTRK